MDCGGELPPAYWTHGRVKKDFCEVNPGARGVGLRCEQVGPAGRSAGLARLCMSLGSPNLFEAHACEMENFEGRRFRTRHPISQSVFTLYLLDFQNWTKLLSYGESGFFPLIFLSRSFLFCRSHPNCFFVNAFKIRMVRVYATMRVSLNVRIRSAERK